MNGESSAVPRAAAESQVAVPAAPPTTRPMYWSLRREFWENRSIYIAPLAVAGVFLLGFMITTIHLPAKIRSLSTLDPAQRHETIALPYDLLAGALMATAIIVAVFYSLDALYGERRDRSILFWKSLPVSDFTTVLSKASIPIVILPLLAFAIAVVTQLMMLLVSTAVLLANGLSPATLWTQLSMFQMWFLLLYHLITVHALGPAPIYAWLLLVSAGARRLPFLWAVLPPLAIGVFEKLVFNTSHFAGMLTYAASGSGLEAITPPDAFPTHPMTHITPGNYLGSPGLWIGLALTAAFIAGAVWLRRHRGPIE
jgi:ABC-2 type transport system permease protein